MIMHIKIIIKTIGKANKSILLQIFIMYFINYIYGSFKEIFINLKIS